MSTIPAPRAYPKRKRTEVSYYESHSENEFEDTLSDLEDAPANKKSKLSTSAAKSKPLPKKKIFPFLSLPPELRNKIYFYALSDNNPLFIVSRTKQYRHAAQIAAPFEAKHSRRRRGQWGFSPVPATNSKSTWVPPLVPSLLALSHQVHAETQPFLYGNNTFAFEDTTTLHAYLANVGSKNCAALKNVVIKEWGYSGAHKALNHPALTSLTKAVSLERLSFECQIHTGGPKYVARQLYRDGHHWLEAVGLARGKKDAGIGVIHIGDEFLKDPYHVQAAGETGLEEFRSELRKLLLHAL